MRDVAAALARRLGSEDVRTALTAIPPIGGASHAVDALARLVEAGARARPAAGVVAELTGVPANTLYRALKAPSD